MPSRKKAQGKARKEKKQAAKQSIAPPANSKSQVCLHHSLQRRDWSQDNLDAAKKLAFEYVSKYGFGSQDIDRMFNGFYDEYHQLNDDGKELFKEMMVMSGTEAVVATAKQVDLSKVSSSRGSHFYLCDINH